MKQTITVSFNLECSEPEEYISFVYFLMKNSREFKDIKIKPFSSCCPFHKEKTPSYHIMQDLTYRCYGCGKHGDVVGIFDDEIVKGD